MPNPFAAVTDILNKSGGQKQADQSTPEGDNIKYRRDVREGLKKPEVIPQPAAAAPMDAATVMAMLRKTLMDRYIAAKAAGAQMLPTWMGGGPPPPAQPQQ